MKREKNQESEKKRTPVMCLIIIPIKTTRERRNKNSSWSADGASAFGMEGKRAALSKCAGAMWRCERKRRRKKAERAKRGACNAEEILVRTAKETSDVISHKINARASEIFSEITDGKYRSVNIQKGAGISAWNGMDRISVDRLSEGTLEQIYFSIRMAASEMLLEEPMPVILDDAFAFYDDKRLESVING